MRSCHYVPKNKTTLSKHLQLLPHLASPIGSLVGTLLPSSNDHRLQQVLDPSQNYNSLADDSGNVVPANRLPSDTSLQCSHLLSGHSQPAPSCAQQSVVGTPIARLQAYPGGINIPCSADGGREHTYTHMAHAGGSECDDQVYSAEAADPGDCLPGELGQYFPSFGTECSEQEETQSHSGERFASSQHRALSLSHSPPCGESEKDTVIREIRRLKSEDFALIMHHIDSLTRPSGDQSGQFQACNASMTRSHLYKPTQEASQGQSCRSTETIYGSGYVQNEIGIPDAREIPRNEVLARQELVSTKYARNQAVSSHPLDIDCPGRQDLVGDTTRRVKDLNTTRCMNEQAQTDHCVWSGIPSTPQITKICLKRPADSAQAAPMPARPRMALKSSKGLREPPNPSSSIALGTRQVLAPSQMAYVPGNRHLLAEEALQSRAITYVGQGIPVETSSQRKEPNSSFPPLNEHVGTAQTLAGTFLNIEDLIQRAPWARRPQIIMVPAQERPTAPPTKIAQESQQNLYQSQTLQLPRIGNIEPTEAVEPPTSLPEAYTQAQGIADMPDWTLMGKFCAALYRKATDALRALAQERMSFGAPNIPPEFLRLSSDDYLGAFEEVVKHSDHVLFLQRLREVQKLLGEEDCHFSDESFADGDFRHTPLKRIWHWISAFELNKKLPTDILQTGDCLGSLRRTTILDTIDAFIFYYIYTATSSGEKFLQWAELLKPLQGSGLNRIVRRLKGLENIVNNKYSGTALAPLLTCALVYTCLRENLPFKIGDYWGVGNLTEKAASLISSQVQKCLIYGEGLIMKKADQDTLRAECNWETPTKPPSRIQVARTNWQTVKYLSKFELEKVASIFESITTLSTTFKGESNRFWIPREVRQTLLDSKHLTGWRERTALLRSLMISLGNQRFGRQFRRMSVRDANATLAVARTEAWMKSVPQSGESDFYGLQNVVRHRLREFVDALGLLIRVVRVREALNLLESALSSSSCVIKSYAASLFPSSPDSYKFESLNFRSSHEVIVLSLLYSVLAKNLNYQTDDYYDYSVLADEDVIALCQKVVQFLMNLEDPTKREEDDFKLPDETCTRIKQRLRSRG